MAERERRLSSFLALPLDTLLFPRAIPTHQLGCILPRVFLGHDERERESEEGTGEALFKPKKAFFRSVSGAWVPFFRKKKKKNLGFRGNGHLAGTRSGSYSPRSGWLGASVRVMVEKKRESSRRSRAGRSEHGASERIEQGKKGHRKKRRSFVEP